MYPFSDRKMQVRIFVSVIEVNAKINVSVPSDVINPPKSTYLNIKRSLLLILSVARTRFDGSTKIRLQIQISKFSTVPGKCDG